MKWKDARYSKTWIQRSTPTQMFASMKVCQEKKSQGQICVNNFRRRRQCPSNYVLWTEENQFWLPGLNVRDAMELVFFPFTGFYDYSVSRIQWRLISIFRLSWRAELQLPFSPGKEYIVQYQVPEEQSLNRHDWEIIKLWTDHKVKLKLTLLSSRMVSYLTKTNQQPRAKEIWNMRWEKEYFCWALNLMPRSSVTWNLPSIHLTHRGALSPSHQTRT